MLFLVHLTSTIPWFGPNDPNIMRGRIIGVKAAKSMEEAARQLGFIRWDGWKKIPEVAEANWKKWGRNCFCLPLITKRIDRCPEKYASINWGLPIITLKRINNLKGPIPRSMYYFKFG